MKTIITRWHGPTSTLGPRYTAKDSDGNKIRVIAVSEDGPVYNHSNAAQALCHKLNWTGTLSGIELDPNTWAWSFQPPVHIEVTQIHLLKRVEAGPRWVPVPPDTERLNYLIQYPYSASHLVESFPATQIRQEIDKRIITLMQKGTSTGTPNG